MGATPCTAEAVPGHARGWASPRLLLVALVALAAAVRLPTLGAQSLWFDEAATWDLMRMPLGEMLLALPNRESNPPLFYVLEWLATRALGDGEAALRAVPALAGVLVVLPAFAIGARIAGERAGLAAALLVAVNPLLVWFSQEARSYALVVLLSAVALERFLRVLDDERPRALAWWAAASGLALCSHYFAAFLIAPQAAWLLWRHPRRRAAVGAVVGVAAVALALLPLLLAQRGNPYDIADSSIGVRLLQVPKQFLLGYRGPAQLVTGLLGAALVAVATWLLVRRAPRDARRRAALVGGIGIVGVLLPAAAATVGADYLNARNLLPALVPLAATLGAGCAAADRGPAAARAGVATLAALAAVSLAVVVTVAASQEYQRPNWRGLARALESGPQPRAIVISPANGELALRYYLPALRRMQDAGTPVRAVDVVAVAQSTEPGGAPTIPPMAGTQYPLGTWRGPERTSRDGFVVLRYRQQQPLTNVPPGILAFVRFGEEPPSVAVVGGGDG